MSAKVKKFIVGVLMITSICGVITGCGSADNSTDNNAVQATTPQPTTTKEPETTTEEPTTEEQTTEYVKKGISIAVEEKNAEHFNDLVIESGHVFYVNDFCSDPQKDAVRGNTVLSLLITLGIDDTEFLDKYFPDGYQSAVVPYEDNYSFTYTGDKKFTFTYMYEKDNGFVYFDLHEVK